VVAVALRRKVKWVAGHRLGLTVLGLWLILTIVGLRALSVAHEAAYNPPLGWVTTTHYPDVYVAPRTRILRDFTNVVPGIFGAGVGAAQATEYREEYRRLAEAEGSQNLLVVDTGDYRLRLTYVTRRADDGWLLHAMQEMRLLGKPKTSLLLGYYAPIKSEAQRPRLASEGIEVSWQYSVCVWAADTVLLVVYLALCLGLVWLYLSLGDRPRRTW